MKYILLSTSHWEELFLQIHILFMQFVFLCDIYAFNAKTNLEISLENTEAWKRKFCSRNDFVPLCAYLFFGCLFVINTSINPPFCSFYFVPFILHAWKIWKYINTSITIIYQRKNLFFPHETLQGLVSSFLVKSLTGGHIITTTLTCDPPPFRFQTFWRPSKGAFWCFYNYWFLFMWTNRFCA